MTNKEKELASLYEKMEAQIAVLYAPDKKRLVRGDGSAQSSIVLIGEAPGEQEALEGRPFVGKAGRVLDEFLQLSGIARSSLYITNTVKVRPTAISRAGRTINRAPNAEELALFAPWLKKELSIIKPKLIVTLGNVALRAISEQKSAVIGKFHGEFTLVPAGFRVYPIYHPAAVIYNRSLREVYESDLKKLNEFIKTNDI